MNLGDTYLAPKGHLWVVASLPATDGSVVVLSVTTRRSNSDLSCIIKPGEHPFIKHETVIAYEYGNVVSPEGQEKILSSPTLCPKQAPVSKALLKRIQEGALTSDLASQKVQQAVRGSMAVQGSHK